MSLPDVFDVDHEKVATFNDDETGLQCIIAIYDTSRGAAVGGTRMYDYESGEAALEDVLRLSRAMAYKTAAADLDAGGGKAVIVGDPETDKTDALLRAYGRAVDSMCGTFFTGEDVGITIEDVSVVNEATDYAGGSEIGADYTARGVLRGIEASLRHLTDDGSLADVDVVVQGCGDVGSALVEHLHEAGAEVTVSDVNEAAVESLVDRFDVDRIDPVEVYDEPCDVFAPCALGGVINDETVDRLACDVVAGSANNQLDAPRHAAALEDRGILYAPDYVLNAGGVISGVLGMSPVTDAEITEAVDEIGDRLERIFESADEEDLTTLEAANRLAERRIAAAGSSRLFQMP